MPEFRVDCSELGRDFAAWLGLVPKQISTGDRTILGKISRRGNRYLRVLFVQAAWVVLIKPKIWERHGLKPWLEAARKRLHHNVLAIALANKLARIAWRVLARGRAFEVRKINQDEVRSFGEKCRLQPQISVSSTISSTVSHPEGLSLLGILGLVDRDRQQTARVDGGGRGTGIEPSPRSQEWSMGPGGPLEVHDPGQNGRRLKESQTAVPGDHPASTWHWDPCQTHIEPAD